MIHSASDVKLECNRILTCAEGEAIEVGNSAIIRIIEIGPDEVILEIDKLGDGEFGDGVGPG